ncbi:MAG TPA: hypothetical protein VF505_11335 [Thermoanaerobaculia bacterium]
MTRHRFALAMLALLLAVLFTPPLVQRQVFNFRDHADYFQPLRYYTSIHLRSFLLPYWNPYSASGEPWLANPQTGVFYPPTWLFVALPFDTAYMLYLALHLLLLEWGAYFLFLRFASEGAALAGATIVTFCGPTMSLVDVSNNLASFAWIPLVIWCAVSRVSARVAALVLAMTFLAGEPFFAAIGAVLYAILVRDWKKTILAGLGAFGLSAVQLLPFVEMLRGSDRAARLGADQIFRESMRVSDWLRIIVPPHFSTGAFDPSLSQHFVAVIYIGVPAVVLALIASVWWRASARRVQVAWLGLLLFSIIVAAGNRLPFAGEVFARFPLTLFRYPSRVVPFGALAIAALAAMGWDRIRPNRRWADLLLVLVIVADLLPRERPLFDMAAFSTQIVPYAPAIGRQAKIIRMTSSRITNRSVWISGYLNLYQSRYDAATAAPVANDRYLRFHDAALAGGRRELIDFLGAGFILTDRTLPALPVVATSGPVKVYLNVKVPPMATFWSRAASYDSPDDALRASIDHPDRAALFISPRIGARLASAQPVVTSATYIEMDTRHAQVVVDAPSDGIVMLTQQDSPSWHVSVDGVEKKKLLASGVFRAVEVARGHHDIVWRFRSSSLYVGAWMTAITSLLLLLSKFVKRNRAQNFS